MSHAQGIKFKKYKRYIENIKSPHFAIPTAQVLFLKAVAKAGSLGILSELFSLTFENMCVCLCIFHTKVAYYIFYLLPCFFIWIFVLFIWNIDIP